MRWPFLVLIGIGCSKQEQIVPLVEADAWVPMTAEEDPFSDRPEQVECRPSGHLVEDGFFEVNTDACAYATFVQPSLERIQSGMEIRVSAWHLDLWAEEPAVGHLALWVDDQPIVDQEIDIPGSADAYRWDVPVDVSFSQGTPITFHLHNHGANSWTLGDVVLVRDPAD